MRRRRALRAVGAGLFGVSAGCLGGDPTDESPQTTSAPDTTEEPSPSDVHHPGTLEATIATNGDYPADETPADGYPPEFEEPPAAPDADPTSFETVEVNGETVRLAPIGVVIDWYHRGEARFVDARGLGQYRNAHVYGAVNSAARRDSVGGSIPGWPDDDRIVAYCGCPHHLSSIRAAGLQKAGVERVFALDEGFLGQADSWREQGYPMAGEIFVEGTDQATIEARITGSVDPRHAGAYVWASAGRQYEAAPIASDGSYDLHFRVQGLAPDTPVAVRTPEGSTVRALSTFA